MKFPSFRAKRVKAPTKLWRDKDPEKERGSRGGLLRKEGKLAAAAALLVFCERARARGFSVATAEVRALGPGA